MSPEDKPESCYDCNHMVVCKYWSRWSEQFPYIDDSKIGPFLRGVAFTLAGACTYYNQRYQEK